MSKLNGKTFQFLFLIGLLIFLWATDTPASTAPQPDSQLSSVSTDSPEKSYWSHTALILGTTVALYHNDHRIQKLSQEDQSRSSSDISSVFGQFGENRILIPSLGVVYLFGKGCKNERLEDCAILSMESLLLATFVTNAIKFSTHRSRPYTGEDYDSWAEPSWDNNNDYLSFPSGHATSAFSVATIIANEYKEKPLVPFFSYTVASLTAISRIHDNKHWASDVFLGSVIGYYTGKVVIGLNNPRESSLSFTPVFHGQGYGLAVTYRF